MPRETPHPKLLKWHQNLSSYLFYVQYWYIWVLKFKIWNNIKSKKSCQGSFNIFQYRHDIIWINMFSMDENFKLVIDMLPLSRLYFSLLYHVRISHVLKVNMYEFVIIYNCLLAILLKSRGWSNFPSLLIELPLHLIELPRLWSKLEVLTFASFLHKNQSLSAFFFVMSDLSLNLEFVLLNKSLFLLNILRFDCWRYHWTKSDRIMRVLP